MSIMPDFEARRLAKESRLEAFKKYGKLYRTGTEVKVYSSVKSPFIQDKIILEKLSQRMIGNVYEVLNDSGFIVSLRVSNILFKGIGDYSDTTFPINRESVCATDKTQYSYPSNEK